MKVVTSGQMKEIEQASLQYDLTFERLMENAGSAAAAFIRRTFQSLDGLNCMIFSGRGNNGGDGFVVARKLHENQANVVVVLVEGQPTGEASSMKLETLRLMEIPILTFADNREKITDYLRQADIIVDGIYGTGFHGEIKEPVVDACTMITDAIAAVVALDIPSGVECDTGRIAENSVSADFTVAFDSLKPVHVLPSGKKACGQVELAEIGIPPEAKEGISTLFGSLSTQEVFSHLPFRNVDSHKGTYGTLLAICGSVNYRGAAVLSVSASLRAGVGICCLASVEPVCAAAAANIPEATLLPLPQDEEGCIDYRLGIPILNKQLKQASAVLFGCGLGNSPSTLELLKFVLERSTVPVIVDADGINVLAENIHVLQRRKAQVILTPHPGEMARLLGSSTQEIQEDRYGAAMGFASEHQVVVVLKGHETLTALPDGGVYINQTGNPGLAKGGSGDVLAGIIGAFCAQGLEVGIAAGCAVHLHGLAADRTASRMSQYGMLPHEIITDLTQIFLEYQR